MQKVNGGCYHFCVRVEKKQAFPARSSESAIVRLRESDILVALDIADIWSVLPQCLVTTVEGSVIYHQYFIGEPFRMLPNGIDACTHKLRGMPVDYDNRQIASALPDRGSAVVGFRMAVAYPHKLRRKSSRLICS